MVKDMSKSLKQSQENKTKQTKANNWLKQVSETVQNMKMEIETVDRGFCPSRSPSCSAPKKYTEAFINHKLIDLLAQASY